MRFDNSIKIFSGDDDDSFVESMARSCEVPSAEGGLDLLANQLMAEASQLSNLYPPPKLPDMERLAATALRRKVSWNWSVAASLLVAMGATVWLWRAHHFGEQTPVMGPRSIAQHVIGLPVQSVIGGEPNHLEMNPSMSAETDIPSKIAALDSSPNHTKPVVSVSTPVVDSQDFMDLDPAVREAVMDLVQEGELQQGPVSL